MAERNAHFGKAWKWSEARTVQTAPGRGATTDPLFLKGQIQSDANIIDAGILTAEEGGMAHVHPAGFDAQPIIDPRADPELGLKQDAAAEIDLAVGEVLELLRRAGLDGDAESGT